MFFAFARIEPSPRRRFAGRRPAIFRYRTIKATIVFIPATLDSFSISVLVSPTVSLKWQSIKTPSDQNETSQRQPCRIVYTNLYAVRPIRKKLRCTLDRQLYCCCSRFTHCIPEFRSTHGSTADHKDHGIYLITSVSH